MLFAFIDLPRWAIGVITALLILISLFMILLVLIQRGKGGGLAGAFGGAGGSSAFGSRAGDTFTKVTIIVAAIWLLLTMILIKVVHPKEATPAAAGNVTSARTSERTNRPAGSEVAVLLSMTGYGEAAYQSEVLSLAIELRALNNRYLKVSRAPEPYNLLESEFEKVVRKTVKRGTLQIHLRCQRQYAPQDFQVNAVALGSYVSQVWAAVGQKKDEVMALLAGVLALPGVVPEPGTSSLKLDEEWPLLERVLGEALAKLQAMRQEEGRAMAQELLNLRDHIAAQLATIRARSPQVAVLFRDRLLERVRGLLADVDVEIDQSDLIKEVSIFAERSDIAEEVVRLASHLDQFQVIVNEPESAGRKLEFLTQEMFREANTIGSKAGDVAISRHVVEIKGALEKIRELIQNVE